MRGETRSASWLRKAVCLMLMVVFPSGVWAQGAQGAMLQSRGTVMVNSRAVPASQAVFPGDLVVTQADSGANLTLEGSSVVVLADSAVRYEGSSLTVERGEMTVSTQKGISTRAGCLTITPVQAAEWTEYAVSDRVGGLVRIEARKGEVTISEGAKTATLALGQAVTRDECVKEAKARRSAGAVPAAAGGILDSTAAQVAGIAVVGGILVLVLTRSDEPVSPKKP